MSQALRFRASGIPGSDAVLTGRPVAPPTVDTLLERIRRWSARLTEFESTTVLSEPETRVKRIDIWVDKNVQH